MSFRSESPALSLSLANLWTKGPLRDRILFTLGILIIYRLGTHIPLPGVDAVKVLELLQQKASGTFFQFLDLFSGGSISRMSIMVLGLMPYISASIIVQLLTAISPHFEALKKEGETGRKVLNRYTRYGTVALASFQGLMTAIGLEKIDGAVVDEAWVFRMTAVVTILGSTLLLMWLAEQITQRGIGQGSSMIIYTGIVSGLPRGAFAFLELGKSGSISLWGMLLFAGFSLGLIAFVIWMEQASRQIVVHYPKLQSKSGVVIRQPSYLPIKLNVSGVLAPIFANAILLGPMTAASFFFSNQSQGWFQKISQILSPSSPYFTIIYGITIAFFAFFYAAIVFNPEETAENLRKNGGFIHGFRPGEKTAAYFEFLLTRLTVVGALYIVSICVIPQLIGSHLLSHFLVNGTTILIVVGTTIETVSQAQSYIFTQQYSHYASLVPSKNQRRFY